MSRVPPSDGSGKLRAKVSAETQTKDERKIANLLHWMRHDLGVNEKFNGNEKDGRIFVTRVLELNKMDFYKAQRFIYKYYKARCEGGVSDFFNDRNSESDEILKSCQSVYLFTLPQLTKGGHKIIYIKLAPGSKVEDFEHKAFFKRFFMFSDIRYKEEADGNGDLFILDFEGFSNQHAMKLFNGGHMAKFMKCLKDTYPRRMHAVHLIRTKPWHRSTFGVMLKMSGVSKKMMERVRAHQMEGVLEGLDLQLEKLSGRMQDLNDVWTQKLISHCSWFESQDAMFKAIVPKDIKLDKIKNRTEEELTISHPSEIYTFKSLEGVFRKIDFEDS